MFVAYSLPASLLKKTSVYQDDHYLTIRYKEITTT